MAKNFYGAYGLTGGDTGALDTIDGAGLADMDAAFVVTQSGIYIYCLDDDSAAAEASPAVIAPDANAGDKRWLLQKHIVPTTGVVGGATLDLSTTAADGSDNNSVFSFKNADPDVLAVIWHSSQAAAEQTPDTHGRLSSGKIYNAVYNDIADFLPLNKETEIQYGKAYVIRGKGVATPSQYYMEEGCVGIASDTFGFGVGAKKGVPQIPIAIGGFVLACVDREYAPGTPLINTFEGKLTEMYDKDAAKFPWRIIATYMYPEKEEMWNEVPVNKRHWVKVK